MASDLMTTMNLADDGEGMVPLTDKPSTAFVPIKRTINLKKM